MKITERVGPIQMPWMPIEPQKISKHVTGMPKAQYAAPVIYAPNFYFPEARIAAVPIP